jgi:hypothetical protein
MIQKKQKRILKAVGTIGLLIASAISARTQETPIYQLYRHLLTQPDDGHFKASDIDGQVNEVKVRALSQMEVSAILPLALQCVRSSNVEVSRAGMDFIIEVTLRLDSAQLLEPYIDDLGKLLDDKDFRWRQIVLFVLGGKIPDTPEKAIAYLEANLERGSTQEAPAITASLLKASRGSLLHPVPADPSIVHKVIAFTAARADVDLTSNVLHEIGLYRIQIPEAINFISANLNQANPRLRAAAVEGASRLEKDARAQLSGQLSQIAADPKEDQSVRNDAARALVP